MADGPLTRAAVDSGDDDAALVRAAQSGDRGALDTLLRRHHDRVFALCRRMTGNEADARDATQEALIAIVRGLPRFDGRAAFTTWIYRIATNACIDELRRHRRRPVPAPELPAQVGDGPWEAERASVRIDVDRALQTLAPDYRVAVVLRDVAGMDYAEIAAVLDIPPGTVRSRIARGRAALARELGGNQGAPGDVQPVIDGDRP